MPRQHFNLYTAQASATQGNVLQFMTDLTRGPIRDAFLPVGVSMIVSRITTYYPEERDWGSNLGMHNNIPGKFTATVRPSIVRTTTADLQVNARRDKREEKRLTVTNGLLELNVGISGLLALSEEAGTAFAELGNQPVAEMIDPLTLVREDTPHQAASQFVGSITLARIPLL